MKYDHMLPIGSLVKVEEEDRRVVIIGTNVVDEATGRIFDYTGVFYPVGYTGPDNVGSFNHEDIEIIYSVGYQDEESLGFQEYAEATNAEARGSAAGGRNE